LINVVRKALFAIFLTLFVGTAMAAEGDKEKRSISPFDLESIIEYSKQFVGIPYRYGGMSPSGFDCSGLLNYVFEKHGLELSRSSGALYAEGEVLSLAEVKPGDFLFFTGRNSKSSRVGHVAMVISSDENGVSMIHATRRGVVIDVLDDSNYYQPRYLGARRLVDFEALETIRPVLQDKSPLIPRI
jgi:cell wall-associated NlpC family hydrolase